MRICERQREIKGGIGNLRDDATDGNKHPDNRLVTNGTTGCNPSKCDNGTSLDVANDCARNRSSLGNNEELRHVNDASKSTRLLKLLVNIFFAGAPEMGEVKRDIIIDLPSKSIPIG